MKCATHHSHCERVISSSSYYLPPLRLKIQQPLCQKMKAQNWASPSKINSPFSCVFFSKDSWQNAELPNVWQKKQVLNRPPEVIDYHIHSYMLTVLQLYQIILHIAPLKAVSIQTVDSHNCKYSQKSSVRKSWTAVNKKNNQTGR